jgi:hypothetical protein
MDDVMHLMSAILHKEDSDEETKQELAIGQLERLQLEILR